MAEYDETPVQGHPIPHDDDSYLKSVPDYFKAFGESIEKFTVMRFATMNEFTTKIPAPVNGMVFWVEADLALYVYANGVERVWPTNPKISFGSGAPTGSGGSDELYFDVDG